MPRKKTYGFKDAPTEGEQIALGMPASTYALNGDVTEVAERLIRNHPEQLGHLLNFQLCFLRRSSSRTDDEFHPATAGGAFIRSDRERGITGSFDGGVWVQGKWWDRFTPEQRMAWIHSYLLRLGIAPRGGKLKMLRPDVIEWASVVRIYGSWSQQLVLFQDGLDAHQGPGGTVDTTAAKTGDRGQRFPHTVQPGAIPPGPSAAN